MGISAGVLDSVWKSAPVEVSWFLFAVGLSIAVYGATLRNSPDLILRVRAGLGVRDEVVLVRNVGGTDALDIEIGPISLDDTPEIFGSAAESRADGQDTAILLWQQPFRDGHPLSQVAHRSVQLWELCRLQCLGKGRRRFPFVLAYKNSKMKARRRLWYLTVDMTTQRLSFEPQTFFDRWARRS